MRKKNSTSLLFFQKLMEGGPSLLRLAFFYMALKVLVKLFWLLLSPMNVKVSSFTSTAIKYSPSLVLMNCEECLWYVFISQWNNF